MELDVPYGQSTNWKLVLRAQIAGASEADLCRLVGRLLEARKAGQGGGEGSPSNEIDAFVSARIAARNAQPQSVASRAPL
jgi:hypothetical protein